MLKRPPVPNISEETAYNDSALSSRYFVVSCPVQVVPTGVPESALLDLSKQ